MITEDEISKIVFEAALKVHKTLGPGLLESAYEECLYYELKKHIRYKQFFPSYYDHYEGRVIEPKIIN